MERSTPIDITILHLPTVDSTNAYAKLHQKELADGTLVVADSQSAGRGRLGRRWVSPPGKNFYGTLLLKRLEHPFDGTMVISLAALAVLRELAPELPVWLKWPNDLYVGAGKLAGVLSEAVAIVSGPPAVITGMGVNLNLAEEELAAIDRPASSVLAAVGREINPLFFASELAKRIKSYYIMGIYCRSALFASWRTANRIIGAEVELDLSSGEPVRGHAAGIAEDGALLVRSAAGTVEAYYCGDVTVSRESVRKIAETLTGGRK